MDTGEIKTNPILSTVSKRASIEEPEWDQWMNVVQGYINESKGNGYDVTKLSDGYHTFDELYEFRKVYNAALFNEWAGQIRLKTVTDENANKELGYDGITMNAVTVVDYVKYDVHKSWKHHDGELCFGGGWFIVVAILPTGQISNHYEAKDWDLFKIPETETSKYPFDGHTPQDVLERLKNL